MCHCRAIWFHVSKHLLAACARMSTRIPSVPSQLHRARGGWTLWVFFPIFPRWKNARWALLSIPGHHLATPKPPSREAEASPPGIGSSVRARVTHPGIAVRVSGRRQEREKGSGEFDAVCALWGAQYGGCSPVVFVQMPAPKSHSEEGKIRVKNWFPG